MLDTAQRRSEEVRAPGQAHPRRRRFDAAFVDEAEFVVTVERHVNDGARLFIFKAVEAPATGLGDAADRVGRA